MNSEYRSRPQNATCRPGSSTPALWSRIQSVNAATSRLRHIQVGNRLNAVNAGGDGGRCRTQASTRAASGQSASTATTVKPLRRMSSRVMWARIR